MSDPMIVTLRETGLHAGHTYVNQTGRFYLKCQMPDWWRVDIAIKPLR